MKQLAILLWIFMLAGCATQMPATTNLRLTVADQPTGQYAGQSAAIEGQDLRVDKDVVLFAIKNDPPLGLTNKTPLHVMVAEWLAFGLQQQGLLLNKEAGAQIKLTIEEARVDVSKPKVMYLAQAKSRVKIAVTNKGTTYSQVYFREKTAESVRQPKLAELENMLGEQLSEIVNQILQTGEIRATVQK